MTILKYSKQTLGSIILLVFVWFSVYYVVRYGLILTALLCRTGLSFIKAFGEGFKENMLLLFIWVTILGLFKGFSLSRLTYRAILGIMDASE